MRNWGWVPGMAGVAAVALLANSFYLFASSSPAVFYLANVLAHPVLGAAAAAGFALLIARSPEFRARVKWAAAVAFAGAALGLALAWTGASSGFRWLLWAHIVASFAGVMLLIPASRWPALKWTFAAGVAFVGVAAGIGAAWQNPAARIRNPPDAPPIMEAEAGAGPQSPFWPSPARTSTGGTLPAAFFMDSRRCGECHKDIYEQWKGSMHHYSSFNNQFYRKSVEHMQELTGTQSSKWCAGCHDHALLFSGMWERPIREQLGAPEAHAGLGCVSCHSIVHVDGSMGNGAFTIEYPELHKIAASPNPYLRRLERLLTHLDPEPHRRTYMKPFMRLDSAEFCSACHKLHLDLPVNNYRWLRGFNDYDNWQASGVSGQGARSFYYPDKPRTCAGCHMPLVPSRDPGHRNGFVRSHRFAAANTAVPFVNGDGTQLKAVEEFLKSGFVTLDFFAASPAEPGGGLQVVRGPGGGAPEAMSAFASGEETDAAGPVFLRELGPVAAPLDQPGLVFQPGSVVRLDVVVRTRNIGHFFPAGTVDACDVWLEVKGEDATGRTVFWSGRVADDGRGPVDPGAHFYRSLMLDGAGNPIDKGNAWQARGLLYVRLIPPGAADVARYRVKIPRDARGPITMTAKLHYRKFSWQYTRFAYAGRAPDGQDPRLVSPHYDSRRYDYSPANIPANAAGQVKGRIPVLPAVTLAQARTVLNTAARGVETEWKPMVREAGRERWNDWGIGLLLQGDARGAAYAFGKVAEADPGYAAGWVNLARALILEGRTGEARPPLERALKLDPRPAQAHYFMAMVRKAAGEHAEAAASLRGVIARYPRDRVAQNQLGQLLLLQRDYAGAVRAFRATLTVDREDVQAHFGLAQAYRGLGDADRMRRHEALFRRFRADGPSPALSAKRPTAARAYGNERQAIHEHESIPLP